MSRFHRNCMLIQTISQAIIATFFLVTLVSMLCFWLFAGAAFGTLFGVAATADSSSVGSTSVPPVVSGVRVIPPDPQLQAQDQARRALRDALSGSSSQASPPAPRFDYNAELRRIAQERELQQMREGEEKARRDALPNGPRQK